MWFSDFAAELFEGKIVGLLFIPPPPYIVSWGSYRGMVLMCNIYMILIHNCLIFLLYAHIRHVLYIAICLRNTIFCQNSCSLAYLPFSRVCLMCANHVKFIWDNRKTPEVQFPWIFWSHHVWWLLWRVRNLLLSFWGVS